MTASKKNFVEAVRERVAEVVVGQDTVVERMMIALLTGGHLLLLGVPGIAKTLLVNAVAKAVDLKFSRVQFTIDMLPSDILGSEILDQATGKFRTHKGPVFTNLLLADEINRAAPKVQSALLEAMQERKVTIGNTSYPLPVPFLVIATQNPIEQAGTFELPEAQLDRFMLCHRLTYPTPAQEEEVLRRQLKMGLKRTEGGAVPKTAFDMIAGEPVCHLERSDEGDGSGAAGPRQRCVHEALRRVRPPHAHASRASSWAARRAPGWPSCRPRGPAPSSSDRDYVVPEDLFAAGRGRRAAPHPPELRSAGRRPETGAGAGGIAEEARLRPCHAARRRN